jgi:hypothetical protein
MPSLPDALARYIHERPWQRAGVSDAMLDQSAQGAPTA